MSSTRRAGALGAGLLLMCVCCAMGRTAGFVDEGPRATPDASAEPPPPPPPLGPPADAGFSGPVLFAHTDTTLFEGDPTRPDAPLVRVGEFDCAGPDAGPMTDLAVTKDGKLYGVSEGAAYPLAIDGGVVHCEATWRLPGSRFYGLAVAPEGTVASREVLIGADGRGDLYEIDEGSGAPTQVGTLGVDPASGRRWALSGDIVFLANDGSPIGFATVRTCEGSVCQATDTLVEVDVAAIAPGAQSVLKSVRGPVVRGAWCTSAGAPTSFGSIFGVAAYGDKVFGFSRTGEVVAIRSADGSGCLLARYPDLPFAGAGVVTTAPVVPPPPPAVR